MAIRRVFVPWYRRGFSTALTGAPTAGQGRARLPATITLSGSAAKTSLPVELAGPGDIVGLDPAEIRRCEPYDGCPDVEPGYFPYVELTSTDLPWRFTPYGPSDIDVADPEDTATHRSGTQLPPWLALVVVPADQASVTPAAPGGLPTLVTTGEQLPPPGESWAWAHVQVTLSDPGVDPTAAISAALEDPSRCVTRLIAPRRLAGATRYGAYLVPAFAAGLAVVDPNAVGTDPLAPAWAATGQVRLPIYFSWSFSTSADGTFETLARRLRPRAAPADAAGYVLDTSTPGWGAATQPDRRTLMQGALRPVGSEEPAADVDLADSLRAAISSAGADIELRPPIYGQDFERGIGSLVGAADGWLTQLNLDPRHRLAAGLAAWAIAVEQEDLADQAWKQLADAGVQTAPVRASGELAALISDALDRSHQPVTDVAPAALRLGRVRGNFPGLDPLVDRGVLGSIGRPRDLLFADPLFSPPILTWPVLRQTIVPPPTTFAPRFAQPAYELLRAMAPQWLLPGAESIPQDSVVVLASNATFVEAYLVGLNHAMAQELVWRGFPLDRDATMFGRFWGLTGGADQTDVAGWDADSALGSHVGGADELVLLIRGSFVARFPTAVIVLTRTLADQSERLVRPNLSGRLGIDSTFVGFPLTAADAQAPITDGGGPWKVVLQEAADHARFGLDDPPVGPEGPLTSWQDLDWGHPQLVGRVHLSATGPLAGVTRPVAPGSADTATWGLSSAHVASALQQPAFRIRIPLSLWLTPQEGS